MSVWTAITDELRRSARAIMPRAVRIHLRMLSIDAQVWLLRRRVRHANADIAYLQAVRMALPQVLSNARERARTATQHITRLIDLRGTLQAGSTNPADQAAQQAASRETDRTLRHWRRQAANEPMAITGTAATDWIARQRTYLDKAFADTQLEGAEPATTTQVVRP